MIEVLECFTYFTFILWPHESLDLSEISFTEPPIDIIATTQ